MSHLTFTEGNIGNLLIKLTFPMLAGLIANLLMQAVDVWFISFLGPDALTAMGFIFPVSMLFVYLAVGLSAGAASVIARKATSGNQQAIASLITDIQLITLVIALLVALLGWLTVKPLFLALGADENLIPLITDYINIFYINGVLTMLGMVGLSSIRALGNTKAQGFSMVAAAIINAVLDPLLIFGFHGFPELGIHGFSGLGIKGAAIAATVSKLLPLAIAYYILYANLNCLRVKSFKLSDFWCSSRLVLHIALPAMANNFIIPLSAAFITVLMAGYGSAAVAGLGIAARIEPLLLLVFNALSSVIGPFMGQNLGAGHFTRIDKGIRLVSLFCLLAGFTMALVAYLGAATVVSWFTSDVDVTSVACAYLYIVPFSYGCSGIIMMVNSSFNGMGKPAPAAIISALRVLIIYLPAAWLGSYLFQVKGIFIAYCLVNLVCAIVAYCWFFRTITHMRMEKG